jgi:hypothetical protein
LEVYVKGEQRSIDDYLAVDDKGRPIVIQNGQRIFGRGKAGMELKKVRLQAEPNTASKWVAEAPAHSKLHVTKVKAAADGSQWLYVVKVNDNPLENPGWLPREFVHWFAEAADVYTSHSPMSVNHQAGGLARLNEASAALDALAERVGEPARQIGELRSSIAEARGSAFSGPLGGIIGGYIPTPVQSVLGTAEAYASIPSGYVRTVQGYVNMPASYAGMASGWAGVTQNYFQGHERAGVQEKRQLKLKLAPEVREQPAVTIEGSLWETPPAASPAPGEVTRAEE